MGNSWPPPRGRRNASRGGTPAGCSEAQAKWIVDLAEEFAVPDSVPGDLLDLRAALDTIVELGADYDAIRGRVGGRVASRLIDWLRSLPYAEGHEPAAPGIYREPASGQLLLVKNRQPPKRGTYAMLILKRPARPGATPRYATEYNRDWGDSSALTAEMHVSPAEYAELSVAMR
jgi:hypothetical protein